MAIEESPKRDDVDEFHVPVMPQEVFDYLRLPVGGCFVDCTVGLGGHSARAAEFLGPQGRIIAIDRDEQSLAVAQRNLASSLTPITFMHDDFRRVDVILKRLGINTVDGLLMDLGISSFQLGNPNRGFSFREDGPLDMRMDQDMSFSAFDLINSLSEREISSILKIYGEERLHNRIARYLVQERNRHPIETTKALSDIVLRALPPHYRRQRIHPATRTFQAFRIAVNRELEALEVVVDKSLDILAVGGRICVISFHSLEDRIVKVKFRTFTKAQRLMLLTKKPVKPSEHEVALNPRARSACLRAGEKM